jgi:hypothetical protein
MNATTPDSRKPSLRDLLTTEYRHLCAYVELAEQEQDALVASDADAIEALAARKQQALSQIVTAREASRHALGEPVSLVDLHRKLSDAGPGTKDVFEMVLAKSREALQLNQLSAKLIAYQTRRLHARAQALTGAGVSINGYGASGFTKYGGASVSLGAV